MDDARTALAYLTATATLMVLLRRYGGVLLDATDAAIVEAACARLVDTEPGTVAGWADLGRIARVLEHSLADRQHPLAEVLDELHHDLLGRRDVAARSRTP
jgi:hypothetical protein